MYLDNELTDWERHSLRESLESTGYTADEIRQINYNEVAPVLIGNVLTVAGEWAGFDQMWLRQQISSCKPHSKRLLGYRCLWKQWINYWVGTDLEKLLTTL